MENIIEIKNVTKVFRKTTVLKSIDLDIKKGETIGIVGSNGSGKSVLFKLICGFETCSDGNIYVRGKKIGEEFDFPENVGALINTPGYIDYYSGLENLKLLAGINNKIDNQTIEKTMELVGLDPNNEKKVKQYSMGMKQKLGIAQAIMEEQDIIILDEPFNALDFKSNREIKNLLLRLKESGKTLLLTSHNHSDIEEICDSIYVLLDGQLHKFTEELRRDYFSSRTE